MLNWKWNKEYSWTSVHKEIKEYELNFMFENIINSSLDKEEEEGSLTYDHSMRRIVYSGDLFNPPQQLTYTVGPHYNIENFISEKGKDVRYIIQIIEFGMECKIWNEDELTVMYHRFDKEDE